MSARRSDTTASDYVAKFILYGEHDSRIEVAEDGDGLGLVEIRQYEGEKMVARVSMHQDCIPMLQRALGQQAAFLAQKLPASEPVHPRPASAEFIEAMRQAGARPELLEAMEAELREARHWKRMAHQDVCVELDEAKYVNDRLTAENARLRTAVIKLRSWLTGSIVCPDCDPSKDREHERDCGVLRDLKRASAAIGEPR